MERSRNLRTPRDLVGQSLYFFTGALGLRTAGCLAATVAFFTGGLDFLTAGFLAGALAGVFTTVAATSALATTGSALTTAALGGGVKSSGIAGASTLYGACSTTGAGVGLPKKNSLIALNIEISLQECN